jgi:hypothetical protein
MVGLFKQLKIIKNELKSPELVKVYEKILPGIWSLKGLFNLVDFYVKNDGQRNVYIFTLRLSENQSIQKMVQLTLNIHD